MNDIEFESAPDQGRPRTATVVGLLIAAAAIFSYLGSYALTNALVAAEVFKHWTSGHDPRPRIFVVGFVLLLCLFLGVGAAARHFSARHLRQIDEMEQDDRG